MEATKEKGYEKPPVEVQRITGRVLKRKVGELLNGSDPQGVTRRLSTMPPRQVVNPLLSFVQSGDEKIKWGAVTALGSVVKKLADEDMEAARVVLRRLMWSLNDESGGIGWGAPEAMGEILACHSELAKEYSQILVSYAREDANYLELEALQRGLLWGIGRLAQARPDLLKEAGPLLIPYLSSPDATVRGLAARVAGMLNAEEAIPALKALVEDSSELHVFLDGALHTCSVKELAIESLNTLKS